MSEWTKEHWKAFDTQDEQRPGKLDVAQKTKANQKCRLLLGRLWFLRIHDSHWTISIIHNQGQAHTREVKIWWVATAAELAVAYSSKS